MFSIRQSFLIVSLLAILLLVWLIYHEGPVIGLTPEISNSPPDAAPTELPAAASETAEILPPVTAVVAPVSLPAPSAVNHNIKILPVPFMVQAPDADWGLPYQEACEEAAMIMAAEYFTGNKNLRLTAAEADKAILQLVEWQKKERGFYEDTTAVEVAAIMKDYFNLTAAVVPYNAAMIRQSIMAGKLVLLPAAGRKLGNPYFRRPGPLYHMLVIRGFDGDEFITNDPGTKRGENYRYAEKVLAAAAHDWNGGQVDAGAAVMIIVSANSD